MLAVGVDLTGGRREHADGEGGGRESGHVGPSSVDSGSTLADLGVPIDVEGARPMHEERLHEERLC